MSVKRSVVGRWFSVRDGGRQPSPPARVRPGDTRDGGGRRSSHLQGWEKERKRVQVSKSKGGSRSPERVSPHSRPPGRPSATHPVPRLEGRLRSGAVRRTRGPGPPLFGPRVSRAMARQKTVSGTLLTSRDRKSGPNHALPRTVRDSRPEGRTSALDRVRSFGFVFKE